MTTPFRLVLATANPEKVREIEEIWAPLVDGQIEIVPRPDAVGEIEEDGATLLDNARIKAVTVARATGLPAVADDTGLEVDALDGAPGVHSARYAGPSSDAAANIAKLLGALEGASDRSARFRTVALVAYPDGRELVAEGESAGTITTAPRPGHPFGYDPVFVPVGETRAFSELTSDEKHAVSHRGRAFRALASLLDAELSGRE